MEYNNLPDLSGLASLRAIVEKGGVSEAARALHVSQSAISKRLKSLEECYGIPLMERVAGRLRLTEVGEKVYMLAVHTLDKQVALRDEINDLVKGKTSLRMEVTFGIGEHLLPDLLFNFKEQYPDYQIDFRMNYSREIEKNLATERVDMALLEIAPDHPDVLVQKWMEDELWLVCAPGHPLFGKEWLTVEELTDLNFVLREKRSSIRESLDEALKRIGIEHLNIALEVGSTEAIIDMLERGKHVSFMPRFAVYERVMKGKLFHIKVTSFRILRTLWIARNRAALDHPVAETFINFIRESQD
ncbi:MAG: LysR family transcriptional regulator [Thioalkalispiraceae bacterium]|jgi:DNA-binding transcriptional LysR family regulator